MAHPAFRGRPFQPLPPPTGGAPYHLDMQDIVSPDLLKAVKSAGKLVCHIGGDTGGVAYPVPQQLVANGMERDFDNNAEGPADNPAFFYHLGDVVYYSGEGAQYFPQFYQPYEHYPAPVVAIPGNHDGDPIDPSVPSLRAFVRNFCSLHSVVTPDAGENGRTAMTQPNVYFTFLTPFATFIGLYTNVPEHGELDPTQKVWLASELKATPAGKALFVCMHHPIHSLDVHHSGSGYMDGILSDALKSSGRTPDIVFAGHVHNYQRFTRPIGNREVPYIVAGASGYWHLHAMAKVNGEQMVTPYQVPGEDATLESYMDTRHGFLRLEITSGTVVGKYYSVPRPQESWSADSTLEDSFQLDLKRHQLVR